MVRSVNVKKTKSSKKIIQKIAMSMTSSSRTSLVVRYFSPLENVVRRDFSVRATLPTTLPVS